VYLIHFNVESTFVHLVHCTLYKCKVHIEFLGKLSDVHTSIFKRIIFVGLLLTQVKRDLLKIKTTIVNYIDIV